MTFTIGFSPCPNDTFIFDALINKKIDTGELEFKAVLEDVETLNKWALEGKLSITKLSYGVLPLVLKNYRVLDSGSALGRGVGPLLISNKEQGLLNIEGNTVAIPGEHTTAHLLFSLAYPAAKNKIFIRYDEIENFVLENKGLGVIIHENRFTYQQKGLYKIKDLGEHWEQLTGNPIPLGGIAIKKGISIDIQKNIGSLIKKSIEYAFSNYPVLNNYIKDHAKEISEDVMLKHIELYVNDFSLTLGEKGRNAVNRLMQVYNSLNEITYLREDIFV